MNVFMNVLQLIINITTGYIAVNYKYNHWLYCS